MAVSNQKLLEWAQKYRQQLESLSDEASQILEGGITSSWSALVDDVARFYRRAQDGSGQYSLSEATKRLEQVNSVIKNWLPARSPELKDLTRQFAQKLQQSEKLGLKFGAQVKKLVYPDNEISQLSAPNFKAVLEAATGIASRMWRYNEDLRIRSGQAVVNSLVRGQSAAGLARQLREFVQQPISGINRIARTELASAYVKSAQRSYEEDGVEYGQWAAVESIRTCPYCAARHMKVYRLSDILIPAHPNCLCSILPVSKERLEDEDFQQESWEEQQAILKELEDSGRRPINTQTPFEKFSGLQPPQPVWEPFDPALKTPEVEQAKPKYLQDFPALKKFGDSLKVLDYGERAVEENLRDLSLVPEAIAAAVASRGGKVLISNGKVPDAFPELKGVSPRGWPEGLTWDIVPGCYFGDEKTVFAGNGSHGCVSLVLHEYGHAVGRLLNIDTSAEWEAVHKKTYNKVKSLNDYFKQGGPGGAAGMSELFAESFASFLKNESKARRELGDDAIDFIQELLARKDFDAT